MEVHGKLNVQGPLDLRQAITNWPSPSCRSRRPPSRSNANPAFILKREAVLVNVQRIRFIGECLAGTGRATRGTAEETPKEQ